MWHRFRAAGNAVGRLALGCCARFGRPGGVRRGAVRSALGFYDTWWHRPSPAIGWCSDHCLCEWRDAPALRNWGFFCPLGAALRGDAKGDRQHQASGCAFQAAHLAIGITQPPPRPAPWADGCWPARCRRCNPEVIGQGENAAVTTLPCAPVLRRCLVRRLSHCPASAPFSRAFDRHYSADHRRQAAAWRRQKERRFLRCAGAAARA
jgi:hypothetical protein